MPDERFKNPKTATVSCNEEENNAIKSRATEVHLTCSYQLHDGAIRYKCSIRNRPRTTVTAFDHSVAKNLNLSYT